MPRLAGGRFVRANVYAGAAVTDQGLIEGRAAAVQALIRRLDAPISVWADVDVKHAAPLSPRPIGELAEDAVERGLAGAVIVSGAGTGHPTNPADLQAVRAVLPAHADLHRQWRDRGDPPLAAGDCRWCDYRHGGEGRWHRRQSSRLGPAYEHLSRPLGESAAGEARRAPLRERRQTFFVVIRVVQRGSQRVDGATRIVKRRTVTLSQGPLHRPHGERRVCSDRGRELAGTPQDRPVWHEPVDQPQAERLLRR